MLRRFVLAVIMLITIQDSFACDICGCSSGNYFIGPFPYFHKFFVGSRYTFRSFKSIVANDASQYSHDFYQTVEVWGGWNISKRWQVLGFIPYNFNRQSSDDGVAKANGLGDITLVLNYDLLNKQSKNKSGNDVNQQLWVGAGLKIPTGKFSPDPNDIIPTASNQAGTGSVDYLLNATYAVYVKNWGISSNVNYKINQKAEGYQFGNRFNSSVFVFRSFNAGSTALNPNVGVLFEDLKSNKLEGQKVPDSGGHALLASGGLEFGFQKISVGFNVQLPVAQNLSNGQTTAKVRGMVHLTFTL
jgi:hypothetical protein